MIYKEFSTVMRSSNEFLRVMRILESPRTEIKILVINHKLKEYHFSKPQIYHQEQTEKSHQFPLYLPTLLLCAVFEPDD